MTNRRGTKPKPPHVGSMFCTNNTWIEPYQDGAHRRAFVRMPDDTYRTIRLKPTNEWEIIPCYRPIRFKHGTVQVLFGEATFVENKNED